MRLVSLLVLLWLIVGAIAAGQRGYYSSEDTNCATIGTIAVVTLLVIGLAALAASVSGATRTAVSIAASVAIWWNLALMAQFGTGMMDRQRLEIGRNAYHAFVSIPLRAPDLAWRYVTSRESFYEAREAPEP